jgi:ParB-like chromosome segregation protein Spo0J
VGNLFVKELLERTEALALDIESLPRVDCIDAINAVRRILHRVSPFRNEPVDCVEWVQSNLIEANDYNPNTVAPPEMKLLECSIVEDGYTMPIVTWLEDGEREVIDGFHRR